MQYNYEVASIRCFNNVKYDAVVLRSCNKRNWLKIVFSIVIYSTPSLSTRFNNLSFPSVCCKYYKLYYLLNYRWSENYYSLTLVYVSRDTMKNPLPVRQQGTLDLMMIRIKSFRIILPLEVIDSNGQGMMQSQL